MYTEIKDVSITAEGRYFCKLLKSCVSSPFHSGPKSVHPLHSISHREDENGMNF